MGWRCIVIVCRSKYTSIELILPEVVLEIAEILLGVDFAHDQTPQVKEQHGAPPHYLVYVKPTAYLRTILGSLPAKHCRNGDSDYHHDIVVDCPFVTRNIAVVLLTRVGIQSEQLIY